MVSDAISYAKIFEETNKRNPKYPDFTGYVKISRDMQADLRDAPRNEYGDIVLRLSGWWEKGPNKDYLNCKLQFADTGKRRDDDGGRSRSRKRSRYNDDDDDRYGDSDRGRGRSTRRSRSRYDDDDDDRGRTSRRRRDDDDDDDDPFRGGDEIPF